MKRIGNPSCILHSNIFFFLQTTGVHNYSLNGLLGESSKLYVRTTSKVTKQSTKKQHNTAGAKTVYHISMWELITYVSLSELNFSVLRSNRLFLFYKSKYKSCQEYFNLLQTCCHASNQRKDTIYILISI